MTAPRKRGGSFRLRMVVFSTAVAALGLLLFAVLASGFYQRELRNNVSRDLLGVLQRTAPMILRISDPRDLEADSRLAGRVIGRLEEFGAAYAVYRGGAGWTMSPNWPVSNEELLEVLMAELPVTPLRPEEWKRGGERRGQGGIVGGVSPMPQRDGVRILRSESLPDEWLFAGIAGRGEAVLMAVPDSLYRAQMRRLIGVLAAVSPVALGLVALCAWIFSSRAIAPIRKLSAVASATTADDLSQRISGEGMEMEFRQLIDTFNGMLARLEKSFGQARRFGQDAAHELNTPLTILTAKVDEAMSEAAVGSPEQRRWVELGNELARLKEIVRKLHLLAQIDGGGLRLEKAQIDLTALVSEVVEEMNEAFSETDFTAEFDSTVFLGSDPTFLRQILLNLLNNGGRYSRKGGSVTVRIVREDGRVRVQVTNTGSKIPEDLREKIFDRFIRGDSVRNRGNTNAGLGLGLSLSREFARALGGELYLACGDEDRVQFVLELPES